MPKLTAAITATLLIVVLSAGQGAAAGQAAQIRPDHVQVACTPRQGARVPGLCHSSNSAAMTSNRFSTWPLPTVSLDISYSFVPFWYIRLSNSSPTPLYTAAQDARSGKNAFREIEPGFNFLSWLDCQVLDGKAVYQVAPGVFARGGGDCSHIATSSFQGLHFYRAPQWRFAWVLAPAYASETPGESSNAVSRWINRYEVVRIYDSAEVGGLTWYRIGDGEWLDERLLSEVTPGAQQPVGVQGDRWISINLYEQTLTVYQNGAMIFATLVSTGLPGWWTQPGDFQVYSRLEQDDMSGSFAADRSDYYFLQDVPWVLYFDQARALHGAYWHNGYGYPRSHGCVNLSPGDARWLYEWAQEDTWVHVFDPSGKTPTDAELYGEGGA